MKTIHLIFNAHLDPVWLWPWQAGLDEALATCRSACDRLDNHPDLIFSRGEAWVYDMVEKMDPALFKRIRKHVDAGRWEIVGGWWIQPDCNQPSAWGLDRQIEIGKNYFMDRFGAFPRVAYNVDSFGHNASLPGIMRSFGQDRYVMMRPQEHEMTLPARIFRWRGFEDGPEVTCFRIANGYCTRDISIEHLQASISNLPDGCEHTMCFVGVGDHGGGPTEDQITWCREHENAIDGWQLKFSSTSRFFDAISEAKTELPCVTGELQMHAIGCYTVTRSVKAALRRAEHLLRQVESVNYLCSSMPESTADLLERGWRRTCFAQFHDTLGGTCLPSAYPAIIEQLGSASADAEEELHFHLRRALAALPDDSLQRVMALNASDASFDGWIQHEPWTEWTTWQPGWSLVDKNGDQIPFQILDSEALAGGQSRILFHAHLEPGEISAVARIDKDNVTQPTGREVKNLGYGIGCEDTVSCTDQEIRFPGGMTIPLPRLDLIEDSSDTWSHSIDRYAENAIACAKWDAPVIANCGPLRGSMLQTGTIGRSLLRAEWQVYTDESYVELLLDIHWLEEHKLLKLVLPMSLPVQSRLDGIPGAWLKREMNGREVPIRDGMLLDCATAKVGIVCPQVYAADTNSERVRLTLLRSPLMAHHDPNPGTTLRPVYSDQGAHRFHFRFFLGSDVTTELLDNHALMMQRPPLLADLTRGMPTMVKK